MQNEVKMWELGNEWNILFLSLWKTINIKCELNNFNYNSKTINHNNEIILILTSYIDIETYRIFNIV